MSVLSVAPERTGSLSAVVSVVHELRNPLATIHASVELLVDSSLSQPQVNRIARNMRSASVKMRELLDEFFERSKVDGVKPCDVRELVREAVSGIAVDSEAQSVEIVSAVPEGLAVRVDPRRLIRGLTNLLVNALQAMPAGGTIFVSAVAEDASVRIEVRDTGPGIPAEIGDRLFEPFATACKAGGLGLGLAFTRQAVMDYGGAIWAESSSRGATLIVRLPMATPQPGAASC